MILVMLLGKPNINNGLLPKPSLRIFRISQRNRNLLAGPSTALDAVVGGNCATILKDNLSPRSIARGSRFEFFL